MSAWERARHRNVKSNYEALLSIGDRGEGGGGGGLRLQPVQGTQRAGTVLLRG